MAYTIRYGARQTRVQCTTPQDFFASLEGQLYSLYSIYPIVRDWQRDLRRDGKSLFRYGNHTKVWVIIDRNKRVIIINREDV